MESIDTLFIGGNRVSLTFLIALSESLAYEQQELFQQLVEITGNISQNDKNESILLIREIMRDYFKVLNNKSSSNSSSSNSSNSSSYSSIYSYTSLSTAYPAPLPLPPPPSYLNDSSYSIKSPSQIALEEAINIAELLDRKERLEEEERNKIAAENFAKQEEEEYQKSVSFYCEICMEIHLIHGSYTLECGHRFCEDALTSYVCNKINSNEVRDDLMICPFIGCGQKIDHSIVRGCTKDLNNTAAYEKYCEFTKDDYLAKELIKGTFITCPTETCNNVFDYSQRSSLPLSFTCDSCQKSYCINCKVLETTNQNTNTNTNSDSNQRRCFFGPGHSPHSCEEQIKIIEKDIEVKRKFEEWKVLNESAQRLFEEAMIAKGWKKCPSCGIYIERNEGCDHMTCKSCSCSFCYICGKYDKANPKNRGDCGSTCPKRNSK